MELLDNKIWRWIWLLIIFIILLTNNFLSLKDYLSTILVSMALGVWVQQYIDGTFLWKGDEE
jgi:hypothetical protein